jgi:hypothetical protein
MLIAGLDNARLFSSAKPLQLPHPSQRSLPSLDDKNLGGRDFPCIQVHNAFLSFARYSK